MNKIKRHRGLNLASSFALRPETDWIGVIFNHTGDGVRPARSTLTRLVTKLIVQIATPLAVLAEIGLSYLAWAGRFTWCIAGSTLFGTVLVFALSGLMIQIMSTGQELYLFGW